jgi:Bacterial regulatory protein, Fis family
MACDERECRWYQRKVDNATASTHRRSTTLDNLGVLLGVFVVTELAAMEPPHCGFTLADVEREHILDTLMCCHGNRTHAAKLLGISLRSLRIKLHDYVQSGYDVCKPSIGADDPPALCGRAKSPAAPCAMAFSQDKILSSLLRACSERSAAHVFSNEISRQGSAWLSLFYDAFSKSIQRYVNLNAEQRLTNAYAEAAGKLGQTLSIKKLLSEQAIQKVLRECALPFEAFGPSGAMVARLGSELNDYIARNSDHAPDSGKITDSQIQKFLTLFPREVYIALKMATPSESAA